jgi:transcriptional regulator with XRE-family HTH domain
MTTQTVGVVPEFRLCDRLRRAREITGLDQAAFAAELGISRTSVSNAETGTRKPIRVTLRAWALRTGVPLVWLETGEVPAPSGPQGGVTVGRARRDSVVKRELLDRIGEFYDVQACNFEDRNHAIEWDMDSSHRVFTATLQFRFYFEP